MNVSLCRIGCKGTKVHIEFVIKLIDREFSILYMLPNPFSYHSFLSILYYHLFAIGNDII